MLGFSGILDQLVQNNQNAQGEMGASATHLNIPSRSELGHQNVPGETGGKIGGASAPGQSNLKVISG